MKNFFFCGIGGIGMSGLARFLYSQGNSVSGSDQANSELIADLQHEGIQVFLEQTADNIAEHCQEFIYSEAIPQHHPERREAARRGIPQKSYFQKLGEVSQDFFTICIAGTHGKSSTTVMAGLALEHAGVDPTVIVGTKVFEWQKKNFRFGNSNFLVVESCEYRESFLHLCPNIIVFTSLEPEHLDYYKTSENYFYAFEKFIHRLPPDGVLIVDESDVNIQTVMSAYTGKTVHSHQFLNNVPQLALPGVHNRQNASKVLALAHVLGLDDEQIKAALQQYAGAWRRFEEKGKKNGVLVFDDYGHHPTELQVTIRSFREKFPQQNRWVVFQPHQYSRTAEFLEEFGKSFADATEILIPNIYRVRDTEQDIQRVSPEILVQEIQKNISPQQRVRYTENFENTVQILQNEARSGDVILTIGAGSVNEVGEEFLRI